MEKSEPLVVQARDNEIIVTVGDFCAVYFRPPGHSQLTLRSRTDSDDYLLLVRVREAAMDKARELGWIV
jgi:hypothetical protein